MTHAHYEVFGDSRLSLSLSEFSATADGLWVGVEESYYCSGLAKASLLKMPKRDER